MNYIKYLLSLFLFLMCTHTICSAQYVVRGKLMNTKNEALAYATVILLNASDSTFIEGAMSDDVGDFVFDNISKGSYLLQADMLTYETQVQKIEVDQDITLDVIYLKESSVLIGEVQVVAKKPLYTKSLDRTTINLESNTTNIGGNVLDALAKSPGVTVIVINGEIRLLGRQGVVLMINNKRVNLEGNDLLNYLSTIPTSNIKEIELINNPPASYDVDGNAGIINIKTLKGGQQGIKQIVSLNVGHGDGGEKVGINYHLDYSNNRFSAYTNLSASHDKTYGIINLTNSLLFDDQQLDSELQNNSNYNILFLTGEIGASYDLTDQTSLSADISHQHRNMDNISNNTAKTERLDGSSDSFVAQNHIVNKFNRTVINTGLSHNFSSDFSASMNYNYIRFHRENPTDYSFLLTKETSPDISESNAFFTNSITPLKIHIGAINFNQKVGDKLTLEYGTKLTKSNFENTTSLDWSLGTPTIDIGDYADVSTLDEQILAGYISGQYQINDQLTFKAGLRYEDYTIDISSERIGNILNKRQGRLYPTAYLSYAPSENFSADVSYNQRVTRPSFILLAPAFFFNAPYRLYTGNSTLLPSNSHNYNFNLSYKLWNLGMSYSQVTNPIYPYETTIDAANELIIDKPIQAFGDDVINMNISRLFEINKVLSLRSDINLTRLNQNPVVKGVEYNFKYVQYTFINTINFNFSKTFKADIGARYFSESQFSSYRVKERWGFSAGMSKTFKKDISVTLNISDILNNENRYNEILKVEGAQFFGTGYAQFEGRIVRATLSIPLGKKDLKTKATKKSLEEMQRLN